MSYLRALRNLNRYGYLTGLDEIDISLEGADFLNSSQVTQVTHQSNGQLIFIWTIFSLRQ